MRISMHAGPVYEEFDPILKAPNFSGRHVNQAIRIEPIVLPGSVFVSENVAALISFGFEEYDFEYDWERLNLLKILEHILFTCFKGKDILGKSWNDRFNYS